MALICGIATALALEYRLSSGAWGIAAGLAFLVAVAGILSGRRITGTVGLYAALACLVVFRGGLFVRELGVDANRGDWPVNSNTTMTVQGAVVGEPEPYKWPSGHQYVELALECDEPVNYLANGYRSVLVTLPVRKWGHVPSYGEEWRFRGTVAGGGMGRFAALRLRADPSASKRLSGGDGYAFKSACIESRKSAAGLLGIGVGDDSVSVGVTRALVLGYRSALTADLKRMFAQTGTLHVFAISGLHVAVMAVFLAQILGWFKVASVYRVIFVGPALVAYTVATGAAPSAVRACLMAIFYFAAPLIGRRADTASVLAASFVAIIAWNPSQLFAPGLVLSFTVVVGLAAICPLFDRWFRRLWERSPYALQPESALRSAVRGITRHVTGVVSVSLAAWVSSMPLTAYYFGWFTPVSVLANLVAVPVTSLILLAGTLSIVLGSVCAVCADIINHANLAFVSFLLWAMQMFLAIPGGSVEVMRPGLVAVFVSYALLGVLVCLVWGRVPALRVEAESGKAIQ